MIEVEICCNSVASAIEAKAGGATRIELCRDLECGGLTPSEADIEYCTRELGLRTHVLVRPRAGDFIYSEEEQDAILRSVGRCAELGAAAVVVGMLRPADGRLGIDIPAMRRVVVEAGQMEVTFHRAFDEMGNRAVAEQVLDDIVSCGCTRLLTSGCAATAPEGAGVIARLVRHGGLKILAGSGVTSRNVVPLLLATGAPEVHSSCKRRLADGSLLTSADEVRALIGQVRVAEALIDEKHKTPVIA